MPVVCKIILCCVELINHVEASLKFIGALGLSTKSGNPNLSTSKGGRMMSQHGYICGTIRRAITLPIYWCVVLRVNTIYWRGRLVKIGVLV